MPITELSDRLRILARDCPEISFRENSKVGNSWDASLRVVDSTYVLEIAEPMTGTAVFESVTDWETAEQQYARWFVESIGVRRLLLYTITEKLMELLPEIPTRGPYSTLKMSDLADECELHVTTISRMHIGKKLHTPSGDVFYRDFFL